VFLSAFDFQIQMDPVLQGADIAAADSTTLAINFNNFLIYGGETYNSILYANIQETVQKIGHCSDENCNCYSTGSQYICDHCNHYGDCDGHDHTWDPASSQCNTARSNNIESCAANVYNTQTDDLTWIATTMSTWRSS